MKTLVILAFSFIAGASLVLLPITDGYTFRGELSGYLPLVETAMQCQCVPPCRCKYCSCDCIWCKEWQPKKTRGQ